MVIEALRRFLALSGTLFVSRMCACVCTLATVPSVARGETVEAVEREVQRAIPPQPLYAPVQYPQAGEGDGDVVLSLTVDRLGRAKDVVVLSGQEPFATSAVEATAHWVFVPAQRGGLALDARIRYLVAFRPGEPQGAAQSAVRTDGSDLEPVKRATGQSPERNVEATPIEVLVEGNRTEPTYSVTAAESRRLPGAFGDSFRAVDVLPGVSPVLSGLPYFYLRGAPPSNVAYYYDGVRVPLLYHFAAGPAVVHPGFMGNVEVHSGAYPARLGAAAGGIVSGQAAPFSEEPSAQVGVRLVDAGGLLELPFAEGRGAVMIGGRYSYAGAVLGLIHPDIQLRYWDYQSRVRYALGAKDDVELLWFGSGDVFRERSSKPNFQTNGMSASTPGERSRGAEEREFRTELDLNFHRLDLRWLRNTTEHQHLAALTVGLDKTLVDDGAAKGRTLLLGSRFQAEDRLQSGLVWRFGGELLGERIEQEIEPGFGDPPEPASVGCVDCRPGVSPPGISRRAPSVGDEDYALGFGDRIDARLSAYSDFVWHASANTTVTPGIRTDVFLSGDDVAIGIDPRLRVRFGLFPGLASVHEFGVAHQMPSFEIPVPGTNPNLKGGLQRAVQHSAGLQKKLGEHSSLSMVLFQNLFFEFTDASAVPGGSDVRVNGRAYGLELMLRRSFSRNWAGMMTYTLSRSTRSSGRYSGPAASDRTHVINLAASWEPGAHWLVGARALSYTGVPSRRELGEEARRTSIFWRLDWRVQKSWIESGGRVWNLVFEVLNTTLNREMVTLDCMTDPCEADYLGPITVPSIGLEATL